MMMTSHFKGDIMKIDITVIKRPVNVFFVCPFCNNEIEIEYGSFESDIGEPCDWPSTQFECPVCEKKLEINTIDWD